MIFLLLFWSEESTLKVCKSTFETPRVSDAFCRGFTKHTVYKLHIIKVCIIGMHFLHFLDEVFNWKTKVKKCPPKVEMRHFYESDEGSCVMTKISAFNPSIWLYLVISPSSRPNGHFCQNTGFEVLYLYLIGILRFY